MTAVAELRTAAAKIRARAEVATSGPWKVDHREYPEVIYGTFAGGLNVDVVSGARWGGEANVFENNDDAYHIALWNPAIALLVADWLEVVADIDEAGFRDAVPAALALARAINATEVA